MATLRALWWWIDRWRKSTAYTDMTLMEQGAYRNLLDEAHLRGGPLPTDERILAKACGDQLAWPEVRTKVLAHFEQTPDGYRNRTLDRVMADSARRATNQHNYRVRVARRLARRSGHAGDNEADNARDNNASNNPASPSPSLKVQVHTEADVPVSRFEADEALRVIQAAYPESRVTYGYITETAWMRELQMNPPAAETLATMLKNLENHKRSHEWRVKRMIPGLDKWLAEGRWKRTLDEAPPPADPLPSSRRRGGPLPAAYDGPDPAGHVPPCASRAACLARQRAEMKT